MLTSLSRGLAGKLVVLGACQERVNVMDGMEKEEEEGGKEEEEEEEWISCHNQLLISPHCSRGACGGAHDHNDASNYGVNNQSRVR